MSDHDSFITEVTEEVRKDRFYGFLRRWGWLIGLALLAVLGGAAINEWRKAQARADARQTGDALRAAYLETDPQARATELAALAETRPDAAPLERIAAAGSLYEGGETESAAAELELVAEDSAASPLFRDLAALQRLMMLGPDMPDSERFAVLDRLSAPEAPFRLLALEQRALAHIDGGDAEAARSDLDAIASDPLLTEGLASRVQQLMAALGPGPEPEAGSAASPPADG